MHSTDSVRASKVETVTLPPEVAPTEAVGAAILTAASMPMVPEMYLEVMLIRGSPVFKMMGLAGVETMRCTGEESVEPADGKLATYALTRITTYASCL